MERHHRSFHAPHRDLAAHEKAYHGGMRSRRGTRDAGAFGICIVIATWSTPLGAAAPDAAVMTAATSRSARGASSPRASRLWRVQASGLDSAPVIDEHGNVFLFDPWARVPYVLDVKTGERRWTGEIDPDMRAAPPGTEEDSFWREMPRHIRRAQKRTTPMQSATLALAGDTLVVSFMDHLVAYSAKDGRRVWCRADDCVLRGAAGANVQLECQRKERLFVIDAATGKTLISHRTTWRQTAGLTARSLVLFSDEDGMLRSLPLAKGGRSWKTKVSAPPSKQGSSITLGGSPDLIVTEKVVAALGSPIVVVDANTGRRLWQRPTENRPESLISGNELWLVEGPRLNVLDLESGKKLRDELLPTALLGGHYRRLAAVGERILFLGSAGMVDSDSVMVTWTQHDRSPLILRQPAGVGDVIVVGSVFLATTQSGGVLSALDPTSLDPPLTSLPAEQAVAALLDEIGPSTHLLDPALSGIPGLGHYFTQVARQPRNELYDSALLYLAQEPVPEALPLLLDRLKDPQDPDERDLLRSALSKQNAPRATQALMAEVKSEPAQTVRGQHYRPSAVSYLHQQIWRTGRSTDVGLCPHAGTGPLPDQTERMSEGEIGTAHPLIFQEVATDGSWVNMCQARADTDGDGKIQVHIGDHGHAFGDTVRPYLVIGSGPGYAFDEILASDATGRYLAVREGPCLGLVDSRTRTLTSLPNADLREADEVFGPARAVSFDAAGRQMLYLRGGTVGNRIVLRDLASGEERDLDPGPGNLWRASLDEGGMWITVEIVDGPEWPSAATSLSPRLCRGSPSSYSAGGYLGMNRVSKHLLSGNGGPPSTIQGIVRPFGQNLLVREPDGTLAEVSGSGKRIRTVVPSTCKSRVLHVDAVRGLVVAACLANEYSKTTLKLFEGDQAVTLASANEVPDFDFAYENILTRGQPQFIRLTEKTVIDLDTKSLVSAPTLGPNEARENTDWHERLRGIYARRGDGTELRGPPVSGRTLDPSTGPLRWMRPIKK